MSAPPAPDPLVLVVEDNPANLLLVQAVLKRSGYQLASARSAEEAESLLRSIRPYVILMDVRLPGEDGLSLTKRLKSDPATASIPIVALTAYAMRGDEQAALAAGCNGYLTKPIDTTRFADQLRTILEASSRS
jgi:two-component system cell cycle response regulator